jgi:DNA-binding transcriptional LysR family regulator
MDNTNRFYYKKSRIQQLRGFCYTVQEGCSARKASERMNLDHTTITLQIRSLEDDLGIKLFERSKNHRLKLTEEGRVLYEMAVVQLQGMDGLFDNFLNKIEKNCENNIIIAGHYICLSKILPKYIKKLKENPKFKEIGIKLCKVSREEAFKRLLNKEVDMVFYPRIEQETIPYEIECHDILKYKNTLIMQKNHPLAKRKELIKDEIKKYEYFLLDKYTFYDPRQALSLKASSILLENGDWDIMTGLVEQGLGIAGMSEVFVNKENNINITSKSLDKFLPKMYFSIFLLKNYKPKESIKYLMDWLKNDCDIK